MVFRQSHNNNLLPDNTFKTNACVVNIPRFKMAPVRLDSGLHCLLNVCVFSLQYQETELKVSDS